MMMMQRALYKNIDRVRIWGHSRLEGVHPQNVAFGYDVGKNRAGCLVSTLFSIIPQGLV